MLTNFSTCSLVSGNITEMEIRQRADVQLSDAPRLKPTIRMEYRLTYADGWGGAWRDYVLGEWMIMP